MTDEQRSFWVELRERKVVRVATVYAVVGWGVVLVGAELVDILQLPAWVSRLVLLIAVLGFPIALVLAWAFELTPDGVRRTPGVVSGATTRLVRIAFIGGLAIGITAIASIASMMSERPDADVEPRGDLDPELVAILPFRYSGPEDLDYLGDGVFQLLASRFTGEVGPRATDPAATAASWDDATAADPTTVARAVAERLGAGLVLTGSVVAGPDGLNISATMRDLTSVEDVVTASVLGPPDSLTAVVERLAGAILSLSVGEYEESLQQLTSADADALREYLRGQVEFRGGRFFEAHEHFLRAVSMDSTFALASLWVADSGNNVPGAPTAEYLDRAWRHRDHLSERDRLYLRARLGPNHPEPSTRLERRRALEEAARLAPERANTWYFLGENVIHFPSSSEAYDLGLQYFERAASLDPRNSNALLHLRVAHALRRDLGGVAEAFDRMAALDLSRTAQLQSALTRALQRGDSVAALALYDSLIAEPGLDALVFALDDPAALVGEWQIEPMVRSMESARAEVIPGTAVARSIYFVTYYSYQDFGMPEQGEGALATLERATGERFDRMRLLDAIYGALPERAGIEAAARLRQEHASFGTDDWTLVRVSERTAIELWRISHGDLSGIEDAVALFRSVAENFPRSHAMAIESQALLLEAMAEVREGDPKARETLDAFDALFLQGPPYGVEVYDAMVLATADTYERLGDPQAALLALERESNFNNFRWPYGARFARERGRLAEVIGDTERAIAEYRYYTLLRSRAAPEFATDVAEVKGRLDALEARR